MTSLPPARCCTVGNLHEGEARGEMRNIGKVSTYFSYPPNKLTEHAILILTDVVGHNFLNAQLLADQFAKRGYLVVMPDLFDGDTVPLNRPEGFQIMDWLKDHLPEHVEPIIDSVIHEMRQNLGVKRIGGVGYCFGGRYVCRYLKPGTGNIDVGYTAHPTMVSPAELGGVEGPLSITAAVQDFVFTTEKRHESEVILDNMDIPYQINLFSDVSHGFAVRCDLSKRRHKIAKEAAFEQAVQWFDAYLKDSD
ncbi:Alpha/Beta hydrolase protein [Sordaria brevicollis]|uniref:Alpha/Beta hydrolase protein n=1 Tax=Sordaria brevicollis TaxID=83679 RepID=A0AAE0PFD1_SORBR|nr:Alpha/Beta hydrolase protein [Sordaria brevicollis]